MNSDGKSLSSDFESFWAPEEDETASREIQEFYTDFFESNDKLKAEIVSHEIFEAAGKKFAVLLIVASSELTPRCLNRHMISVLQQISSSIRYTNATQPFIHSSNQ